VALRCLLVDDSRQFLDAASSLLGREGLGPDHFGHDPHPRNASLETVADRTAVALERAESSASAEIAAWKRYEATISELMASVPVSIVCAYNETELAPGIVADARRTHPVLRSVEGARPSAQYAKPGEFVRSLEPAGLSS
jgi:hypothetical protein